MKRTSCNRTPGRQPSNVPDVSIASTSPSRVSEQRNGVPSADQPYGNSVRGGAGRQVDRSQELLGLPAPQHRVVQPREHLARRDLQNRQGADRVSGQGRESGCAGTIDRRRRRSVRPTVWMGAGRCRRSRRRPKSRRGRATSGRPRQGPEPRAVRVAAGSPAGLRPAPG